MATRNYGMDALRMLSMLMVLILHILGAGGILASAQPLSPGYWAAWGMEIACYCAVNCFALISGYVMSTSRFRSARLLELWLQTVCYTFGMGLLFSVLLPGSVSSTALLYALTPVTRTAYWYITAYFGLCLLSPLFQAAVRTIDQPHFRFSLWAVFVAFSVLPTLFLNDPYRLINGYSTLWLCLLFFAGAYLRKYRLTEQVPRHWGWLLFLGSIGITFAFKYLSEVFFPHHATLLAYGNALIQYTSPTILTAGMGLFFAMGSQRFPAWACRVIAVLSPATLGVYLIHVSGPFWSHVLTNAFSSLAQYPPLLLILLVIAAALVLYLACSLVELLRIYIFRLFRITALCTRIGQWVDHRLQLSP